MAIAATTSSIPVSDAYGLVNATGSQVYQLPIVMFKSDSQWTDQGALYGYVGTMSTVTDTTYADVTTIVKIGARFVDETTVVKTATHVAEWSFETDVDNGTLKAPLKQTIPRIGLDAPSWTVATFEIDTDGTTAYGSKTNVHGFYFEEFPKQDGAVQSLIKPFSATGTYDLPPDDGGSGTPEKFSLFDAEMPCSAYVMKYLVCNNANAVGFRTLTRVSFPLMGSGSSV